MNEITYKTILTLISNINAFAEQSDQKIQQLWTNFSNSKQRLEDQYKQFMTNASTDYNSKSSAFKKRATTLKENAENIYQEVVELDTTLANADKYYVKTREKKMEELAQRTDSSLRETEDVFEALNKVKEKFKTADKYYVKTREKKMEELAQKTDSNLADSDDVFEALNKVKEQFKTLSDKYSKDKLPALFDGINYLFSKQRKQDYEDLIVLKNTLETIISDVILLITDLVTDTTQEEKDNYNKKVNEIKTKYTAEMTKINDKYEHNIEALADEICEQLDAIIPEDLLYTLKELNQGYFYNFSKINTNYNSWDGNIMLGCVDYPLELYVSSNILFSLIKDKCANIVAQSKLLRFPLVFSLKDDLNILIKHLHNVELRNEFICSIMQSFIASTPVTYLSFYIIDTASAGNCVLAFSEFLKKLPDIFSGNIITEQGKIEDTLKNLVQHIKEKEPIGFEAIEGKTPSIKVLIIFDPLNTIEEKNISLLNDIIANGSSGEVYTILCSESPDNAITEKKCVVFQQAVDIFLYYELHALYMPALAGSDFSKNIRDYLLIYDTIKGNITLIDSQVRELLTVQNLSRVEKTVENIKNTLANIIEVYGTVPQINQTFPTDVPLGFIAYPENVIADANILSKIKSDIGVENTPYLNVPAIFNLKDKNNLLITCPETSREQIERFVHNLMWSFLSFLPIGKVNFCIIDAERRGNSITPFLDFKQKLPDIFDGQIYTTADAMTNRLQKINRYIDEFIQEKLGNRYDNIVDYNINTPTRTEAVTLLIIFDFPRNFDSRNIEMLQNILINGARCGIYTIIIHNPSIVFSKYESIDEHLIDMKKYCSQVEYTEKKYVLQPYGLHINIAPEMDKDRISKFLKNYVDTFETLKKVGLSFEDAVKPPYFQDSSAKRLSIPIGIGDGESIISLILGEGSSHHGLIAGATGSGKSTLLHTLIMSAMLSYSPDNLHLYLMDFKSGTEFKVYESTRMPHIQLLALDAMQEFGESILENLVGEMTRRSGLFKDAGQSSLAGYTQSSGKPLPRILVIMDEFQILFNDSSNRKVAMNCAELTKRIVTEGRSFGIHLLMATQTTKVISELTLSHGIIEQMRIRIGLKCGADDARYLFGDRNDSKSLEMMKGPIGTAVMNLEYMESNCAGFRAAYCSDTMQEKYLSMITKEFASYPVNTQIFEGNRTVSLVDYLTQNKKGFVSEPAVSVYMGTLIKVAPPFVMQFDRRRRHNLLVCGANERMSENLTNLCMVSALLNTNTDIYCIDGESLIGDSSSASVYECLSDASQRFKTPKSRPDIIRFINDIFTTYSERKKGGDIKHTLIVIKNIQYLDIIKKMFKGESVDESEYVGSSSHNDNDDNSTQQSINFGVSDNYSSMSSLSITDKLLKLIDDGSNYGVFFIVSSLEFQSVKENMYYGENVLSKFPERIVFSLSNNDADNLIDGVAVSGLRDNTVYYTDGVKNAFQFKPYTIHDIAELKEFLDGLPKV